MSEEEVSEQLRELREREGREIALGHEAYRLLHDEHSLLRRVLSACEAEWSDAWRSSTPAQKERREEVYRLLLAKDEITSRLQSIVDSGKLAERARLNREATQKNGDGRRDS